MAVLLYELVGKDNRRYSGYCWRARMAVAHKGLDVTYVPCRHGDIDKLAFSGQAKVPVLVDGEHVVADFLEYRLLSGRRLSATASLNGRRAWTSTDPAYQHFR